jgi:hypothetical protein
MGSTRQIKQEPFQIVGQLDVNGIAQGHLHRIGRLYNHTGLKGSVGDIIDVGARAQISQRDAHLLGRVTSRNFSMAPVGKTMSKVKSRTGNRKRVSSRATIDPVCWESIFH